MKMKQATLIALLLLGLTACDLLGTAGEAPSAASSTPAAGATQVPLDTQITVTLELPNGTLNPTTLTDSTVYLMPEGGSRLSVTRQVLDDSETLVMTPEADLAANTTYRFEMTSGVRDISGRTFRPYSVTFSTGDELGPTPSRPSVEVSRPADGAEDVCTNRGIATDLKLAGSGVEDGTLTSETVRLFEENGAQVAANVGTSGGYDTITLVPRSDLKPLSTYRFEVTNGVTDQSGKPFVPFAMTFTTGSGSCGISEVAFETLDLPNTAGYRYSSLAFGPDGKLYASTIDGLIRRFSVNADGTLSAPQTIPSLQQKEGGERLLVGLAFDPDTTANNLVAWVSHTAFGFQDVEQPWSGKITRLSGPNLETVQDYVVGLPRSYKDHVTNSVAFGPDGALYVNQGSNTAIGAPDSAWGFQEERLLSGATLRLDLGKLGSLPLDAQTEDGDAYDPFASDAPLTLYGRGIRNAYDLVWHSNGNLYVPANGSAAGGVTPRYDADLAASTCSTRPEGSYSGPRLDEPDDVNATYLDENTDGWEIEQTMDDYLFRVEKDGYYGHPNPKRCEWILNGGGSGRSDTRIDAYPSDVESDPNYRQASIYSLGKNFSPNGVIEYTASGPLQGNLLVTRFSLGDDILAITLDDTGNVVGEPTTPRGLTNFADPIDLVENPANGFLYISEYDQFGGASTQNAKITLAKPVSE